MQIFINYIFFFKVSQPLRRIYFFLMLLRCIIIIIIFFFTLYIFEKCDLFLQIRLLLLLSFSSVDLAISFTATHDRS